MKNRIGVVILVVLCLGLGIALITVKNKAAERQRNDADLIGTFSNKWVKTDSDLVEQKQVSTLLEKDLETQKKVFGELTNSFAQVSSDLSKSEGSLKAATEELLRRDARIAELETQNQALDKKSAELTTAITNLTVQIASTQRRLDASEGNKAYLEKELKRMMAEKSELERQFSDLTVVRAQVAKLKEEIATARRVEWMRQGILASSELKGGQRLMLGLNPPAAKAPKPNYDLNVEVSADGSVKVIPPLTNAAAGTNLPPCQMTDANLLIDSHGRTLRDLRVSITDRCNFRCLYCLPETEAAQNFYRGHWAHLPNSTPIVQQWVPKSKILSFEEIERAVRVAVGLGIQKIRLTGGEPLLRQGVEKLVERIASIPGITDLAMTTNGFLFPQKARALRDAGLRRVSFSMDSLDADTFRKITGRDGLKEVLEGISLAQDLGFHPVKVNAVIIREINEQELEALAEFAHERNVSFRFIEFMPLDSARAWLKEMVVPGREIMARLHRRFDLRPVASDNPSATAKRWAFADGRGELGMIAPVSEPFCGHCNRIRLTADGKVRTCLFSVTEHDLRSQLRNGATDEQISDWLKGVVWQKEARHHIGEPDFISPPRSMSCIGG